ncbi:glycosyltransferase family 8 protein [Microcoleus sp. A003_D6]|uniref:glycosyltransferase family 8 protein n=1 Tax=Microcoleus sp. A003_D6 TaxID=3055266 RepID=UPI002FD1C22D
MTNTNHEPIVLISTADDNYAMPLAVTVKSVLVNLKNKRKVVLYVLDGNITPANKHKIAKSLDSELIEIFWVQPDESLLVNMKLDDKYNTLVVYYRLFIGQLIPKYFNKAIYIDSDVVVLGDLEQLWNLDVGDQYLLAVQDTWQRYIKKAMKHYDKIGIHPDYKYFNAGVLVINLEKWRADNVGTNALEFITRNRDYLRWHDQDGLNGVLAGKWGELDPSWNQMKAIYDYSSWTESPYTEEAFNQALHHPRIVHFADFPKPWQPNCKHPKQDLFFQYMAMTAWNSTDTSLASSSTSDNIPE